jgi:hypothetical protein
LLQSLGEASTDAPIKNQPQMRQISRAAALHLPVLFEFAKKIRLLITR